jgi:hypothetical protein
VEPLVWKGDQEGSGVNVVRRERIGGRDEGVEALGVTCQLVDV